MLAVGPCVVPSVQSSPRMTAIFNPFSEAAESPRTAVEFALLVVQGLAAVLAAGPEPRGAAPTSTLAAPAGARTRLAFG